MTRYIFDEKKKKFVEKERVTSGIHYVQPDLADFMAGGVRISGKRQWRDHLKRTGSVETSPQDLERQQEKWHSKQSSFKDRLKGSEKRGVRESDAPVMQAPDYVMSRINSEMANRLDGRPAPDRKTLIKLTLETARALSRRF